MRKIMTLVLAVTLAASSLTGCILTPIDANRRTVTNWDLELIGVESVHDVPKTIFGAILLPVAWVTDAVLVNPIDSYKGAVVDTHTTNWDDMDESGDQAYAKGYQRSFASLLYMPLDFAWRANSPINAGPHDAGAWKEYWNDHVEVTEVGSAR